MPYNRPMGIFENYGEETYQKRVITTPSSNTYCMPAALSALTGCPVDDLIPLIRQHLGDKPITGVFLPVGLRVLSELGYRYKNTEYGRKTLNQFVKWSSLHREYFVEIPHHALVISRRIVIDNANPEGIDVSKYPARRSHVVRAFEVWS